MNLETIRQEARAVAEELITTAQMKPGQILVVGCSSSEIHNSKLGTDSSQEIGQAVFEALCACTKEHGLYLAAQCCEHLNRAVVLERAAAEKYGAGLRGTVAAWRRIVCDGGILWIGGRCHRRACAGACRY